MTRARSKQPTKSRLS